MNKFENRERLTLEQAETVAARGGIAHIIVNDDKTYSVMSHINCEHCDYCAETNLGIHIHNAKSDPYEFQKINVPENYGLPSSGREIDKIVDEFEIILAKASKIPTIEWMSFLLYASNKASQTYRNERWTQLNPNCKEDCI